MEEIDGHCLMMPNNENDNREVFNSVHSGHKHSSLCSVDWRSNISAADDISQHIIISNKKNSITFCRESSGQRRVFGKKGQSTGQESDGQGEVNKMKGRNMKGEEGNRRRG